jgi:acetyl esterase/lipase
MTRVVTPVVCIAVLSTIGAGMAPAAQPASSSGKSLEERFHEFDRNGDGKLTPDEFPASRIFQEADANKDDVLTLDELRAYFQRQSAPGSKPGAAKRSSPGDKPVPNPGQTGIELVKQNDVRYAEIPGVDPRLLSLDLYAPKGAKALPIVVYVHGGFWQKGDKGRVGELPQLFGKAGCVLASVNYRLSPAAKHPAHIEDIARAILWLQKNAASFGGDPEQMILMGHSAGAHLVALAGTDLARLEKLGVKTSALRGIIPMDSAAMDLREMLRKDPRTESPYRQAFGDEPQGWADASPMAHAERGGKLPPFFLAIAYGPALENKRRDVQRFVAALRKTGTRADLLDASAFRSHESLMTEFGKADDPVAPRLVEFVRASLEARLAGRGKDEVLHPTGKMAKQGAKEIEAYRQRVVFRQFDKNRNGKISREEMTGPLAPLFDRLGTNKDGFLSPAELDAWFRQRDGAKPSPDPSLPSLNDGAFTPDDVALGDKRSAYIDPELLQTEGLATFLDAEMTVWVGTIDPGTGLFKTPTGRDHRIDTGISKWSRYCNGPEWGLDAKGPALFYVKDNAQGVGQLWRAQPPWDKPRLTQLTHDTDIHNWICEPSVNTALSSTRVIIYRGKPQAKGNVDAWIDEDHPDKPKPFTERMIVARWAYNTSLITFAYRARPGQTEPSQVVLVDTDSGQSRVITGDDGNKIDPWLWQAPEFNGEVLLCANTDGRELRLYRDVKRDGSPWQCIATLHLPAEAPHKTLKSVEPINGGRGAFGRSYFTVQAGDDKDPESSIWLFGFDPKGDHLIRRLDDGAVTGKAARRLDPETYIGDRELFVYYNLVGEGPSQMHRCRTGVKAVSKL